MQNAVSPPAPKLVDRLARLFVRFMELEIASAVLLMAASVFALLWSNSPWSASYFALWEDTKLGFHLGDLAVSMALGKWVNDGLMVIFFFAVGMEIKREMVSGELSTREKAMLPVLGGLGGMIAPAGIYLLFHAGGPAEHGWGVPMATDIAFAVAALSVFGRRVPPGLRVFLLALAIVDDLAAVTVIALFYTAELHVDALALAGVGLLFCVFLNWIGVRSFLVYVLVGIFVWYETHHSGVHATIAGVALGLITPTAVERDRDETLFTRARHGLENLRTLLVGQERIRTPADHTGHQRHHVLRLLAGVGRQTMSPLDYLLNLIERPVALLIMPIFALANAGVALEGDVLSSPVAQGVGLAVALGLFVGKPLGITLFCWVGVRLRLAVLPLQTSWWMVKATGALAGIGFTVALFITALAFTDPLQVAGSKVGILTGSVFALLLGMGLLHATLPKSADAASPVAER